MRHKKENQEAFFKLLSALSWMDIPYKIKSDKDSLKSLNPEPLDATNPVMTTNKVR